MKEQRVYFSDEGTTIKPQKKTTKWSGDRQPSRKRIQNNDSEDLGSQKKNGEDARNVPQRPRWTKEQTEMKQYTRRNL